MNIHLADDNPSQAEVPLQAVTREYVWESIRDMVLDLENRIFEPSLRYTDDDFVEEFHLPGAVFLLARNDDIPVGYLHAVPMDQLEYLSFDDHFGMNNTLYVVNIALLEVARGNGTAEKLFSLLTESTDMKRFSAHAVSESSRRYFIKMGFHEKDIFTCWMNDRDGIYLVKDPGITPFQNT